MIRIYLSKIFTASKFNFFQNETNVSSIYSLARAFASGEFQCFGCGDKFKKVMALNRHVKQDSCKLKHIQQHLDVVGNEVKEWTVCYGCAGYFKSSRIGAHLDKKRRCVLKHFEVLRDKKGSTDAQMNDLMEEYAIEHLQELIGIGRCDSYWVVVVDITGRRAS